MAAISNDLLDLLADPETHEPLSLASADEFLALKRAIKQGKARRRDGQSATDTFEGALFSQNQRVAYLIEAGIPNLLLDERLELLEAL